MQENHQKKLTSRKEVATFRNGWRGCAEEDLEITDIEPPRELSPPFGGGMLSECLIYSIDFNLAYPEEKKGGKK